METQVDMEKAHREFQEERPKERGREITEEQFLKDLYIFMKKRDTPIERIPHLGFKQIDLFVMFKTVNDLGGYQQVTFQQLWKQVYNTLGGNPRSTSAATCTRRHYEKLLLPYECHVKGIIMDALPQQQPKPFHYVNYGKDDDGGQRPAKRKMLSLALDQSLHHLPSDPHRSLFPLPLHYPHYYHPSNTVLPPYGPISSSVLTPHSSPPPKSQFPTPPSCLNSTDKCTEPLEHLRTLSEWYKTSSGLVQQPLNLSKKASPWETTNSKPVSSFSPPSSSKNPKFLNKPSTLYTTLHAGASRNEESEPQEGESSEGVTAYSYPVKARDADTTDMKTVTSGSMYGSPLTLETDKDTTEMPQMPSSPKKDFTIKSKEGREASTEVRGLNLSHILPSLPRQKEGKMEIEIPLSVFHSWLKLYRSSATTHEAKEPHLTTQEEQREQRNWSNTDIFPTSFTFQVNSQGSAEDLRLRNVPSPNPSTQTTSNHCIAGQTYVTGCNALPSGGILKNAASRDVNPFDRQDINKSYNSKYPMVCDAYDKETQALIKTDSSSFRAHQDFASKFHTEDISQAGKQRSEMGSSAVLMVNSSPLWQLTNEEVMKLKKMISNS